MYVSVSLSGARVPEGLDHGVIQRAGPTVAFIV